MITTINVNSDYKSIKPLVWSNIPPLAVITGVNGVGKSQFLQLLHDTLGKSGHPNQQQRQQIPTHNVSFNYDGDAPSYDKTLYIPNTWQPGNFHTVSRGSIDGRTNGFINWVRGENTPRQVPQTYTKLKSEIERRLGKPITQLQDEEIYNNIPFDFMEQEERISQNNHLSEIFLAYLTKRIQLIFEASLLGTVDDKKMLEIDKSLGEAPWEKINEAFKKYNFDYRVNYPKNDKLDFQCRFISSKHSTPPIEFSELSSGEKMIVTFILWVFNQKLSSINNLIIMDEPDAHLHPSMCKLFLKIVYEILVQEYGVQVILTTHSPSTVALLPENSIFVMNKSSNERIVKSTKTDALEKLTENLLLVTTSFRVILVEDKNDCAFYETVYNELIAIEALEATPALAFKPASTKNSTGGKKVVESWVKKLNEADTQELSLRGFIHGIIDRDQNNLPQPNLHVLNRYSIENYLVDPILIFANLLLNDNEAAKEIALGTKYTKGNLYELFYEEQAMLSDIANNILAYVNPKIPNYEDNKVGMQKIKFINDQEMFYPDYLFAMKGHDLFQVFHDVFGKSITRDNLIRTVAITRLVPQDLVCLFNAIKSNDY